MRIKKSILIVCIAVCLFAMAGVCAGDVNYSNDTMKLTQTNEVIFDENNNEQICVDNEGTFDSSDIDIEKEQDTLKSEDDESVGGSIIINPSWPLYELDYAINNNNDPVINLYSDYYYDEKVDPNYIDTGAGIVITRGVTINGNGHTIDGRNLVGIFLIANVPENITLKNIHFKNCNSVNTRTLGGAIRWSAPFGYIYNCTFTNNCAESGGAIYRFGSNSGYPLVISGCNFNGNHAESGGAIYWDKDEYCSISNCSFNGNYAESGGAIYLDNGKYCSISNCSFSGNDAELGGAIYWNNGNDGSISECSFMDNQARRGGAAFLQGANGTVSCCSFVNNRAVGKDVDGGALSIGSVEVIVSNCSFINNHGEGTSSNWGHSIFYNMGDCNREITGCLFADDSKDNAAVYINSGNHATITNNIFLVDGNPIGFNDYSSILSADFNWFGNTESNRSANPNVEKCTKWLFMVSTAQNNANVFETVEVIFKLYLYDSGQITEYDNSLIKQHKLKIIPENGIVEKDAVEFGEVIRFTPTTSGTAFINATMGNSNWSEFVHVSKISSGFSIDSLEFTYDEKLRIPVRFNEIATGSVDIKLNGKNNSYEFNKQLNNTIILENINVDEYLISAVYSGDDKFKRGVSSPSLTVTKANSTLNLDYIVFDPNTNGFTNISFIGAIGINVEVIPSLDDEGTNTLLITVIPDSNHIAVSRTITIPVNKIKTEIIANSIIMVYDANRDLVITLKDNQNNLIKGVVVAVDLNGVKHYVSDENGQVKVSTKDLVPKTYTVKITFNGNGIYAKSTKDVVITVKKANPKIIAKKKKFKKSSKVKKYTVTLKSNVGNAMTNVKLTIKIGKKTFGAKTNKKGKATFKIKKLTKKGKYTAKVTFKGDKCYTKLAKKVKITVK